MTQWLTLYYWELNSQTASSHNKLKQSLHYFKRELAAMDGFLVMKNRK